MLGGLLEGQLRKCYQSRTGKIQFYVDFSSGNPVVNHPDISIRNNGNGVYIAEIVKPYNNCLHINSQLVVSSVPTVFATIQTTFPSVGVNTLFNGLGNANSMRFTFVYQNLVTGAVSLAPNNVGIYFELIVQNSTFGY